MSLARDIDFAKAISSLCKAYNAVNPGQEVFRQPDYAGVADDYPVAAAEIKATILFLKSRLSTLDVPGLDLRISLASTHDPDICTGLPTGQAAPEMNMNVSSQMSLVSENYAGFLFRCDYGLAPPEFKNTSFTPEDLILALLDAYTHQPDEEHARLLKLYFSRGISAAKILFSTRSPGRITTAETAALVADILKEKIASDPINANQAMALMATRSDLFCVMAMMLAGCDPELGLNARALSGRIVDEFKSNHGRLAMERRYGPLQRHLLEHDRSSFTYSGDLA